MNHKMYMELNPDMEMQAYCICHGSNSGHTTVPTNHARNMFIRNIVNWNGAPLEYL